MSVCIVCKYRPAAVPDRNRPGKPVKRVCHECHAGRLLGDMQLVVNQIARRERAHGIARVPRAPLIHDVLPSVLVVDEEEQEVCPV